MLQSHGHGAFLTPLSLSMKPLQKYQFFLRLSLNWKYVRRRVCSRVDGRKSEQTRERMRACERPCVCVDFLGVENVLENWSLRVSLQVCEWRRSVNIERIWSTTFSRQGMLLFVLTLVPVGCASILLSCGCVRRRWKRFGKWPLDVERKS